MLKAIGLDCDTTYEMDLDANQKIKKKQPLCGKF
jgi:hypothetical protein